MSRKFGSLKSSTFFKLKESTDFDSVGKGDSSVGLFQILAVYTISLNSLISQYGVRKQIYGSQQEISGSCRLWEAIANMSPSGLKALQVIH